MRQSRRPCSTSWNWTSRWSSAPTHSWSKAIEADPYADIADDPAKHLLGFFSAVPAADRLAAFEELVESKQVDPEIGGLHHIDRDHCYLWCPQGALKSLFGTVDWDRKLGVTVTMRNWTTALKLIEMSA